MPLAIRTYYSQSAGKLSEITFRYNETSGSDTSGGPGSDGGPFTYAEVLNDIVEAGEDVSAAYLVPLHTVQVDAEIPSWLLYSTYGYSWPPIPTGVMYAGDAFPGSFTFAPATTPTAQEIANALLITPSGNAAEGSIMSVLSGLSGGGVDAQGVANALTLVPSGTAEEGSVMSILSNLGTADDVAGSILTELDTIRLKTVT